MAADSASEKITPVVRRLVILTAVLAASAAAFVTGGAQARSAWPSRRTPVSSTLGWFEAINAHDRARLLTYVAPSATDQMGWARPGTPWSTFTHLHCHSLPSSTRHLAIVRCSFHESASPDEGNPDTFWNVELRPTPKGWLIDGYGQG
jgi:hypothetical protein